LTYTAGQPFAAHLKKYFSADKKYGSRDRKQISHLCYCYFRLGKMKADWPVEKRILLGWILCAGNQDELIAQMPVELADQMRSIRQEQYAIEELFPWKEELSKEIDHEEFCRSFLVQPDLFLRIRPGKEKTVIAKMKDAGIDFKQLSAMSVSLPNSTKIENIIELNKDAVVQDYNSQAIGSFLENLQFKIYNQKLSVWDCCAASGGKSIMAKDKLGDIDLVVSDIRENILQNLKKRFSEAGIKNYTSIVADLANCPLSTIKSPFNLIIADVPCTGSGTWGRTPEQLFSFEKKKINEYADKQKKIMSTIIPALDKQGYLLYITCSVFRSENEEIVDYIKQQFSLEPVRMEILKGYDKKADTMFAALLRKDD
jgi:16S rRNA (cytosine967-C5)-methyltransferase